MIIDTVYVNGRWPCHLFEFSDWYPIDGLRIENFSFNASDYDVGDDQVVCPCGAEIYRQIRGMPELGAAIKIARDHLVEAHGVAADDERLSA
jgi:hypothetical protein